MRKQQKHDNYDVISAAGNHIVLIDNKITITKVIRTKAMLFCQRLSDWFDAAEVDEIIAMSVIFLSAIAIYDVFALPA